MAEYPEVFHHVGLLVYGSSAVADYPLSKSADKFAGRLIPIKQSWPFVSRNNGISRYGGQRWSGVILRLGETNYYTLIQRVLTALVQFAGQ